MLRVALSVERTGPGCGGQVDRVPKNCGIYIFGTEIFLQAKVNKEKHDIEGFFIFTPKLSFSPLGYGSV